MFISGFDCAHYWIIWSDFQQHNALDPRKQYYYINQISLLFQMRALLLAACLVLCISAQNNDPSAQAPNPEVVMSVGQIFPGQINVQQNKQALHFLKVDSLQRKYLFIRVNSQDKVRLAIGLYSNDTRQIVYACEDNIFDSCYVPSKSLKQNTAYVILIVADDSIKYNLYTYWGDLEHLKPNQEIKFMFDNLNPTQLFHLEFENEKQFEQIRLILKPETARVQGDNLKIYANLGFSEEPSVERHQYESVSIWGDAQAIIFNKDQIKQQKGIGIYIVGNAETVYIFEPEFLKHTTHTLKIDEVINDYLPKEKAATYRMNFKDNNNVDSFVIKVSAFTGEISAKFYYDESLGRPYEKAPYQYMSDLQFNFERSDFESGTKQIFMQIKAADSQATYQISTQARSKDAAYQIAENIYEFVVLNKAREAMYFYSHVWDSSQFQQAKTYRFDISMIKIFGNTAIEYYRCKPDANEAQCKNVNDAQFQQHVEKVKPFGVEEVGSKIITTLEFSKDVYKSINNVERTLMIVIMLVKNGPATESAALAIQYTNPNQIRVLREGRAFEDKVRYQEKNYYKYVNNNDKISEIRIHINEITGLTKVRAKRDNILQTGGNEITLDPNMPDTIVVRDDVTKPIYIEVSGVVTSLYTISVTAVHTEHLISNSLIMAEDVEYEVKLLPYQHMNVEIHPIQTNVVFEYYAEGGAVMLCRVDDKDLCVGDRSTGSHGQLKIDASSSREIRIRIGNYFESKTSDKPAQSARVPDKIDDHKSEIVNKVKLTLIYHAEGLSHCDERRLNKVYSENVKSGTCLKFHLPIPADLEIMASRSDLGQTMHMYFLCSKKVVPVEINDRYVIKADVVKDNCKENLNEMLLQMIVSDLGGNKSKQQIKMDYAVEYYNDTVTLAEGVAYVAKGYSVRDVALRTYFYDIIDEDRDVNILLYNKKGIQKFYARVVNKPDRYTGFVSESESKFSSKNSNYYTNPYIKITPRDIADAKCGRTCVLILSIYSTEKVGSEIEYALEVTQNHVYLKQDQIKTDFLAKGSVRFYEYEGRASKGSLIFKVSDNNRKCARSIMSKNPFPTSSNYFIKENDGIIVYQKSQKSTYYFAVEAVDDCPYTVSVSEGEAKITKIEHGEFYDIKLSEGEEKWFYTRHISNNSFKIVSLKQKGELTIYANETDLTKQSIESVQNKKLDVEKFAFKSSYMNTLLVDFTAKGYCFNCYYLICIKAIRATQASILLGSENSKISLTEDKILFDEIQSKSAVTYGTFYKVSDGKLQVKVHAGAINFEMSYSNQKYSKSFAENKKVYHENYNFTKEENIFSPIEVRITASKVPALYSFELEPSTESKTYEQKVNPGEHTFIYLEKGKEQCFKGSVSSTQEYIFLSVDSSQKFSLNTLNLKVKVDGNLTTDYDKQIVGNILSVKFKSDSVYLLQPKTYDICINTDSMNESLAIFVFQNHKVNLIHSDTEVLVKNQAKFVLYPRSDVIVDLFQCKGTAEIYYGNNLEKIREKESHKLDMIGIPGQSHAIKISEFSTVYLDISAEMATVLWMPIVEKEERGVGYFKYNIGGLEYSSKFNNIQFKVGGVYKSKQTKTKVVSVRYTIYVSDSKELLQEAVMCQKTKDKLVSATIINNRAGDSGPPQISVTMDKKRITDAFTANETLYFNAVADLTLEPPEKLEGEHEHYRFVYFQQVVPAEMFRQNKIESLELKLLIVLAVVSVVGFVLISCIFVRCIVPAIGRLKNRVLVEEKDDPKDQSIPVPPSSDRNQIPTNLQTGTEEQMAK